MRTHLIWITVLFLTFGCTEDSPEPGFLRIRSFTLTTQPQQGAATQQIVDGWVYSNGRFIGVYRLPALFPTLETGDQQLEIFPGILRNGSSQTPDIHPFLQRHTAMSTIGLRDTFTIDPVTSYLPDVEFRLVDGFEGTTSFNVDVDTFIGSRLVIVQDPEEPTNQIGQVQLQGAFPEFEIATGFVFRDLPADGSPVYMELDYRNNVEISVGLIGSGPSRPPVKVYFLNLRAREVWNKIYIDLSEPIAGLAMDGYQIVLRAIHDPERPLSEIWLDNVKLMHFQ